MKRVAIGLFVLITLSIPLGGQRLAARQDSLARLQPEDFGYLGAFRLPAGEMRPRTFEYGGAAMTFRPDGDPGGVEDGFSGSLFVMGHNRMPYGELPDGNQVAEITIPRPLIADTVEALPQAAFVQGFHDVAAGFFGGLDEIPRVALQYLNTPATGPLLHLAWGQHLQSDAQAIC